ncbi:MAG: hypothetical protein JSU85_14375, partial [Candidatus Zixiibacteriota bacterium]
MLRSLFEDSDVKLDVIADSYNRAVLEKGVITAGNFSPFCSTINWIWGLKRRLFGIRNLESADSIAQSIYREWHNLPDIARDKSLRSFINSFCQVPDPYAGWVISVIFKILFRRKKYDFIISTAPPWSSHLAAIFIGRLLGIPVILDDRDPWIGNRFRMSIITHPLIRRIDKFIAEYCYSKAAGIVSVTRAACDLHKEKSGDNSM